MTSGFGARLRAQREQQQIALVTIAEQTKIKASLLEGLEREDLSNWPGGVFRRSYVRAYAIAIGLDAETVLREFQERFPEAGEAVPEVVAAAERATGETLRVRPPTRLRFLIGSALDALPGLKAQIQTSVGLGPRPRNEPEGRAEPSRNDHYLGAEELPVRAAYEPPVSNRPTTGFFELTPPPVFSAQPLELAHDNQELEIPLEDVASLCTRIATAEEPGELQGLLEETSVLLDAVGVTLWMWDPESSLLHPVLTYGYPPDVVAQLPSLSTDTDTAVSAAFREAKMQTVDGTLVETGAVVVPLKTASCCAGVLALEFRDGGEQRPCVRACARIIAAQLSMMVGYTPLVHAATA